MSSFSAPTQDFPRPLQCTDANLVSSPNLSHPRLRQYRKPVLGLGSTMLLVFQLGKNKSNPSDGTLTPLILTDTSNNMNSKYRTCVNNKTYNCVQCLCLCSTDFSTDSATSLLIQITINDNFFCLLLKMLTVFFTRMVYVSRNF